MQNIKANVEITYKGYTKRDNMGKAFGAQSTHVNASIEYLEIGFNTVPIGLPAFQVSSSVFLRNFFTSAFSVFGVTKQRKKFSSRKINKALDFYFPKTTTSESINNELSLLFGEDANKIYMDLISSNFTGDLIYNEQKLVFKTMQVPENTADLEKIKLLFKPILKWVDLFKKVIPNPINAVKRIGHLIKPELVKEIKWKHTDNHFAYVDEYPEPIHRFISVISIPYWTDTNYTNKPVHEWLQNANNLPKLALNDLKSLFTYFVRQERFCEGFWQIMTEKDYVSQVLKNPIFIN